MASVFTVPAALAEAVMAADVDLFGNPIERNGEGVGKVSFATNDIDQVESVLRAAVEEGFALVGASERVYRRVDRDHIEDVSSDVDALVHELIDRGWLEVGGTRHFSYGPRFTEPGRSVLVPRRTKNTVARWRSLHRPQSWNSNRKRRSA